MVRNGYGTKMIFTMVRNGRYEMVMVRNDCNFLKLLSQSQPNFAEMILGWPPSKVVSGDPDFQPRWPPSSK